MRSRRFELLWFALLTIGILGVSSAAALAAPANDLFANAMNLQSVTATTVYVDNRGAAANEVGEPTPADENSSVWYKWTAPADDMVSVDTNGSYDPLVGVSAPIATVVRAYGPYGSVPAIASLTQVPELTRLGDFLDPGLASHVVFPVVAGQVYFISISSPALADLGITRLNLQTAGNTGHITGTVTATNGGTALSGIRVDAYALGGGGNSLRTVRTNGAGFYDLTGLGSGSYQVKFSDESAFHTYLTEWYNNSVTQGASTTIAVTNGALTPGKNAVLDRASSISGTVRIDSLGTGTPNVLVQLLAYTGDVLDGTAQTQTGATGTYSFTGLYPKVGSGNYYRIQFIEPAASGLTTFFYNQKTSVDFADKLQPIEGTALSGKDGAWWTDFAAPTTTLGVTPTLPAYPAWKKGPVSLAFSAVDAGVSGVAKTLVSIDGTGPVEFTPPSTIGISKDGTTEVRFWSLDNAGNSEVTQTVTFKADSHAPATTSNAAANYPDPSANNTITLSPTDAFSGVATTDWAIVNAAAVPYSSGSTLAVPLPKTKGDYTITFHSTDNVGNQEAPKTAKFTVGTGDVTAPTVTPVVSPSTWTSAAVVSVTLNSYDASSNPVVVQSKAPGELVWTTQISGQPFDVSAGPLAYQAWDTQGNTSAGNVQIKIDRNKPVTTTGAAAGYLPSSGAVITLLPADADSGVASTSWRLLNPSAEFAHGSTTSVPVPAAIGSYTLEYASTDVAGNREATKTASFAVSASAPLSIYRFYNMKNGSHFYTADAGERDSVLKNLSKTYSLDGVAYTVNTANPANSQWLYRFYNKKNGSHFYTASESEKASVIKNLSATYSYDGPAYKVSPVSAPGSKTVWRFYNKKNGSHFYTADDGEKASVIKNLSATYSLDGAAFFLAP